MKTQEELQKEKEGLKKQHGTVYEIDVLLDETEENVCTVFLKKPDRTVYSQVAKFLNGTDSIKAIEIFIKGTYIGGDAITNITTNDYALRSLDNAIAEIMYVKQSSLKKN